MRSVRVFRLATAAGFAISLVLLAGAARAQTTPWDQKAVTAIAVKLEKALGDLNVTVRRQPQATVGTPQRRAQFQARESLRLLVNTSQRLTSQLEAGEDLDATLPTYRRLQMLRRDAERAGRRGQIPAPTLERVVSVRGLLDELSPFYAQAAAEEEAAEQAEPAEEAAPAP
ncbi:hypothetical protein MYXO_03293 [Myxococcaceae bacterium]|jgi:hypothetical protein|nr:hypothetical protein MYXO_03293 [Myxococcaceae bacterium]